MFSLIAGTVFYFVGFSVRVVFFFMIIKNVSMNLSSSQVVDFFFRTRGHIDPLEN